MTAEGQDQLPELAFYYPNPMWSDRDWVKNLILFFDGIALLVPEYMKDRPFYLDPAIATGLNEHNLLKITDPETFIDRQATESLANALTDILVSGALDDLAKQPTEFHQLSYSRLGHRADAGLAEMIYDELRQRGLAKPSTDGLSIPMHPMVRSLVLVLLAQILRARGRQQGLQLSPATDLPQIQNALTEMLGLPTMASSGHVVSLDMETVGVDLSAIPIDEVLDFRSAHRQQYRAYTQDLRRFLREVGNIEDRREQQQELAARKAEITERADALRKAAYRAWKRPLAFAISLAGAAWKLKSGDLFGGVLAGLGPTIVAQLTTPVDTGAYSYLFSAKQKFDH